MYLPLNEGAGQEVADHGPHNFDTELSKTAPKWVDAKHDDIGKAMEFDGKGAYVKIDMAGQKKDIDSHFNDKQGMTICAWVKVLKVGTDAHGQTRQPIVMKGNANQWEFALYLTSVSKPNPLGLGCRHRLIGKNQTAKIHLTFGLKCSIIKVSSWQTVEA